MTTGPAHTDDPHCHRPCVLVFDVNETLLDLDALAPHFGRMFGDAAALRTWFGEMVMYSMTLTLSGYYTDFFTLGRSVLQMLATIRNVTVDDEDLGALEDAMRTMPAHPDVQPGLDRLRSHGYRLVTLTNSPHRPGAASPLENAGLSVYFEQQFTVDSLRVFKPATHLYRQVAAELAVHPAECMMVAAHTWDIIGAHGAGMCGALVTRPGNAALIAPTVPQPDVVATDISDLADRLATTTNHRQPAITTDCTPATEQ